MPAHVFWKGYLKLSLVTCPVAMLPAVSERQRVRFHTLNRATGNRVQSIYVDSVTDQPVSDEDEAKGYPAGPDRFVIIEDNELASVSLESSRTIDIETFVSASSIGWLWYDRPHYLVPDDMVGEEAFAVIRAAMTAAEVVGIARLVLYGRERAVMLQPRDRGIVLWTLRFGDEVRDPADYFDKVDGADVDPETLKLVCELIRRRAKPWEARILEDPVQANLLELIAARRKRRRPARRSRRADPGQDNVVNIIEVLRKSLAEDRSSRTS